MQFLTREASADWCATNGFGVDFDRGGPTQPHGSAEKFEIPPDAGRRVALARLLWESVAGSAPQALLWVTEFGVWPSSEHRPLAESARAAWGAPGPLAAYPGQLVGLNEHEDGLSGLVLAILFLWDCWLLHSGGSRAAFLSHDEFGIATFREEAEHAAFCRRLELFKG
jgi:hypothetical protein